MNPQELSSLSLAKCTLPTTCDGVFHNPLQSTEKITEHQFYFDITQYFVKQQTMTASFDCHFPEGNARFQKVGIPKPRSLTVVIGFIMASAYPMSNTCAVKKMPIEVAEIQYLTSLSSNVSTTSKGHSHLHSTFVSIIHTPHSWMSGAKNPGIDY